MEILSPKLANGSVKMLTVKKHLIHYLCKRNYYSWIKFGWFSSGFTLWNL